MLWRRLPWRQYACAWGLESSARRCRSLPQQLHLRGLQVLLRLLKGETLPPELREGSPVRAGSDTNFGDSLSDAVMDQVLRFGTTA